MGDPPSFNDPFTRRAAPGARDLGSAKDHFRKSGPGSAPDPFKAAAKPHKPPKDLKPAPAPPPGGDAFARTSKSAKPGKAPSPPGMTAPMKNPFARAPLHPPKTRSSPPEAAKPASQKATAQTGSLAAASDAFDPFVLPPEPKGAATQAPVEASRPPLQVVPAAPAAAATPSEKGRAKSRPAGRSSSLVLVSGAGAVATAETLEAPPPPAVEKAQDPPAADPPPADPAKPKRADGGGTGEGPPGNGGAPAAAPAIKRGFNQDDMFGVVFGVAVILFMLLWLTRGRSEEAPGEDTLVGVQSAANQQTLAASPPAPQVDPFGDAPVDLRPSGPIPDPLPEPDAGVAAATPPPAVAPATPPVVAAPVAPPQTAAAPAVPLAERKMNAWFCTASSTLTKASRAALETELTTFADVFAGKELVVRGYADTRGTTDYNSLLGGERAKTVADFLSAKGLAVAEFTGVGELDGLDDNQNCPNQRRVDVWVKDGPAAAPSRACTPEPEAAKLVCG